MTTLEARLQRIEDRQSLWDLAARYCVAVDDRDIDGILACFARDGSMGHADGATEGQGSEGLREYYESKLVHFGHCYHYPHSQLIDFTSSDTAEGIVSAHAEMVIDGESILAAMRYYDSYVREAGGWRFRQRRIKFFYTMPIAELASGLAADLRKRWPAPPSEAELPGSIRAYQEFRSRVG